MSDVPGAAAVFYNRLVKLRNRAEILALAAWADVSPNYLSESWARLSPQLVDRLAELQVSAAVAGADYGGATLAQQGQWEAPQGWVEAQAFSGWASNGSRLAEPLASPIIDVKTLIGGGMGVAPAMKQGSQMLKMLAGLQISDAGRGAASVDTAVRPRVGYTRMLNPPSCARCVVLAGRFYRWNAGFRRHPHCDCVHVQTAVASTAAARAEGLVDDPYEYFHSLTAAEQEAQFGRGYASAIRDGGDIYQVVNSRRGRLGVFTTEGYTRRGYAKSVLRPGQRRMTPDTIYRLNPDRDQAIAALRAQGYILPGGQVPGGSIRGNVEGFGQMGRGGTRKAASQAVLDARRTGVRDPNIRYTMTAAERRLYDAEAAYKEVLAGRNPYVSTAFLNTPDPYGLHRFIAAGPRQPLTPQIAASVEAAYRDALAKAGQRFI